MRISWENLSVMIELDNMRKYIELIENAISEKEVDANRYGQRIDELLSELKKDKSISEEEYEFRENDLINDYLDEFSRNTNIFPQKLRATTFIHLCSILETILKNKLNISDKNDEKLKGYPYSLIHKIHSYLEEKKEFNIDNKDWKFVKNCNKIRNRFVHEDSLMFRSQLPDEIKQFIETNEDIMSINNPMEIHLKEEFNAKYLDTIENIFISLEILPYKKYLGMF